MTNLNKTNIDKIIEVIRDEDKYFNMKEYTRQSGTITSEDCGTASCICGWANHIRLVESGETPSRYKLSRFKDAADWLGMEHEEADELFHINVHTVYMNIDLESVTKDDVIVVLENLKETGEVNWGITQA